MDGRRFAASGDDDLMIRRHHDDDHGAYKREVADEEEIAGDTTQKRRAQAAKRSAASAYKRKQPTAYKSKYQYEDHTADDSSVWLPLCAFLGVLIFVVVLLCALVWALTQEKSSQGLLPVAKTFAPEKLAARFRNTVELAMPGEQERATFSPQYTGNENVNCLYNCEYIRARMKRVSMKRNVQVEHASFSRFKRSIIERDTAPFPFENGTKGIVVTCVLDELCLANLLLMVHTHKTKLPIELWLQKEYAQPCALAALQQKVGDRVTLRYFDDQMEEYAQATARISRSKRFANTQYKLMALAMSSFEKVLLVDQDSYLVQTPDQAMETCIKAAKDAGAVFWHDVYGICPENPVWQIVGVVEEQGYAQESGLVFIDKSVAWRGLYLAAYMNQRQLAYYNLLLGDKDTFFLSFESLGLKYKWVPYVPYILCTTADRDTAVGVSFLQPDVDGVPLAVHLVSGKPDAMNNISNGEQFFSHVWTYDPNSNKVGTVLRIVPNEATNNNPPYEGVIEPSSKFIGNFPDVIAAQIREASSLLSNCTMPIGQQEDTVDALVEPAAAAVEED